MLERLCLWYLRRHGWKCVDMKTLEPTDLLRLYKVFSDAAHRKAMTTKFWG